MEAKLAHFINDGLDWFNTVPGHNWYVLGATLASIPAVIGILQFIKAHHYKKTAEDLANHFIALNLVFWSTVMTVAGFVITNGTAFGAFLPYLNDHMPQILAGATTAYTFAKAAQAWFNKPEVSSFAQNLDKVSLSNGVQAVTSPVTSFGTAANGVTAPQTPTQPQPAPNLLQL